MPPNYSFLAAPRILEHLGTPGPGLDDALGKVAFIMKIALYLLLAAVASVQLTGQALPSINQAPPATSAKTSPDSGLRELLLMVQAMAQKFDADVARLRIDRWKADAQNKQQSEANEVAIRRNLADAVPDMLRRIQAEPDSLIANFRFYRNLNALYDSFSVLAESAGAFGPQDQYAPLPADIAQLDQLRRHFAERVDLLAGASDAELAHLRAAAAKRAQPASRIVVDDNQPSAKKKPKTSPSPAQPLQQ
jgi:hypothetical protein